MVGEVAPGRLVHRFYEEIWNKRDQAAATEILSPGLQFRGSIGVESLGVESFLDYVGSVHHALGDYRCTIEDLVENDRRAVARMRFEGRHIGVFLGVGPTGRRVVWSGAAFFSTDGQRITKVWVLGDVDALRRQLS